MAMPSPAAGAAAALLLAAVLLLRRTDASRSLGSFAAWKVAGPKNGLKLAVCITGAGTGLGRAAVLRLAQAGWVVFAGVINEHERESLSGTANLVPVILNVADSDSIARAVKLIQDHDVHLLAVVNNANVMAYAGPLEHMPDASLLRVLDVGVLGCLRVSRALLPLLRDAGKATGLRPRLILISSGAGLFAPPLHGAYAIGKFALEATGDVFRRELADEVDVALLEFSMIGTDTAHLWNQLLSKSWSPAASPRYDALRAAVSKQQDDLLRAPLSPEEAARAVAHACTCARPAHRYQVGISAAFTLIFSLLPSGLSDWIFTKAQGR